MKIWRWELSLKEAEPALSQREVSRRVSLWGEEIIQMKQELTRVAKQVEATRKKVYRDEVGGDGHIDEPSSPKPPEPKQYKTGDPF